MQVEPKKLKAEDLFGVFSTLNNMQKANVGYKYHWQWPKDIGTGDLSMIKFRPGLMMGTGKYHLSKEMEIDFSLQNPYWVMAFNVSKGEGAGSEYANCDWNYEPGKSFIFFQPEWQGTLKLPVYSHVGTVSLYISPELLNTFLDSSRRSLLRGGHPILDENYNQFYSQPLEMTSNIQTAINQILNCPYKGSMSHLYLEGKTMELLTYSLSQFLRPEDIWKKNHNLSDDEVKQIHRAKELLCKDLRHPPRLLDLARGGGPVAYEAQSGFSGDVRHDFLRVLEGTSSQQGQGPVGRGDDECNGSRLRSGVFQPEPFCQVLQGPPRNVAESLHAQGILLRIGSSQSMQSRDVSLTCCNRASCSV